MSQQMIALKTINDLRVNSDNEQERYFIASYQRGYRWSPQQVRELLEDIREFTKRPNPQQEDFYCLQPLVLKVSNEGGYEVVDGQQRLTTIMLILRYFNERLAEKYQQKIFQLEYQTRPNLLEFLDSPTEEQANKSVDFFHLFHAVNTIGSWFSAIENEVEDIKSALLNRTKVIWFQLADIDNPVSAFTRLNVGKIPLTNEELIRALFLKRIAADEAEAQNLQLKIAYEWDLFEKSLQSNTFWYFVSNQTSVDRNRIGLLFNLVAEEEGVPTVAQNRTYDTFYAFNQKIQARGSNQSSTYQKVKVEKEWHKVKSVYQTLEEWFENRVLYHLVGYLVAENMSINSIRSLAANCTKTDFEEKLRQEIFRKVIHHDVANMKDKKKLTICVDDCLEGVKYGSSKVKPLLLLFNIATLLQNNKSNIFFQFESFKNEDWDIEHIRSVSAIKLEQHTARVKWLKPCLDYFHSQNIELELQKEIDLFLKLPTAEAKNEIFDPLHERVLAYFHEGQDSEADNLTLLDQKTNRGYKNAVFAVKRQCLLALDQAGIFVPLCTRNVFLKCYSPQVDNVIFWSVADREGYLKSIKETFVNFFNIYQDGL